MNKCHLRIAIDIADMARTNITTNSFNVSHIECRKFVMFIFNSKLGLLTPDTQSLLRLPGYIQSNLHSQTSKKSKSDKEIKSLCQ